jgi:hypothetical protein
LTGNTDIENSLDRLDKLTVEEMRMASAELLKITHNVQENVQVVRGNVQGIGSDVKDISRVFDDKFDQVNRSLLL